VAASAVVLPVRRLHRTLGRSWLGRRAGDTALRNQYRWGRSVSKVLQWVNRYEVVDAATRARSVPVLVELFFDLVEALDARRFLEAGAKDGSASLRAAQSGRFQRVVAFEPNPYTFLRFAPGFQRSGVTYEQLALVDGDPRPVTFYVKRTSEGRPRADGQGSMLIPRDHPPGFEQVTVEGVTLDSYVGAPDGVGTALWVDVEGATAEVLRGAAALLEDTSVVIAEVEVHPAWLGQEWLAADVIAFLRRHGLVPVARDRQSRLQFNIVFVRSTCLSRPEVVRALRRWRTRTTSSTAL
jgi:FkbM family methyltransferase